MWAETVPGKHHNKEDVEIKKFSSVSSNQFLYTWLPINPLRRITQPIVKVITVSAIVRSLEMLAAVMRYRTARNISSSPVQ